MEAKMEFYTKSEVIRVGDGTEAEIVFDLLAGYVSVIVSGYLNVESSIKILKIAARVASEHGSEKVHCDVINTDVVESLVGIYHFPSEAVSAGIPRNLRIAVLYSKNEESHRFWETRSRNTGFAGAVFKDRHKAIEWLDGSD